jgi:hypothetical protein
MKYVRIFSDPGGLSHFDERETEMAETNFAPPAPPFLMSPVFPAADVRFGTMPPGWFGDWHPSPQRQFRVQLVGEVEFEVGDGTVRRFGPGSVILLEDLDGKGHRMRVVSNIPSTAAYLRLI